MEKVTRSKSFETNSSSTHSITIASSDVINQTLSVVDGVVEVYPGEYGWGREDSYNNASTKASYCLTHIGGDENGVRDCAEKEMLMRVIKEVTGAHTVNFVPSGDSYHPWGYIDHQSAGEAGLAFADDDALKRFIFNDGSVLYAGNDNG